ncbi:MAG: DNA helicase RecQ, partial [Eubacteriales bacterium]
MRQVLKEYFGYDAFRDGQEQLISATLSGRDALGIMPTGGGKSICFQVPALMMEGITLVISPLISLMQDQVDALVQSGVAVAFINSTLSPREMDSVLYDATQGVYRLIYVAPERLFSPSFLDFVQRVSIAMVAVDEAHCISQWGQDFRPSYSQIPQFLNQLPTRPVVTAYTATATQRVRDDIVASLELRNPEILVTGFDRENLRFAVKRSKSKMKDLVEFLEPRRDESGIIYCSTRKNVDVVWEKLDKDGYSVGRYHAGLPDEMRKGNQREFLFDRLKLMVATNAFGMGIDKSNVAFVVHYNMPKDMESYYQEAGRSGRDGSKANCLLLYGGQDVRTQKFLIENGNDTESLEPELAQHLKNQAYARLEHMEGYASTNDCLRQYILRYFGENRGDFCGNCGNCLDNTQLVDVTVTAQKILSCIYRMGQRFGIKLVIEVLRGSKNKRVLQSGFNNLSTYGICKETEDELLEVVNLLLARGYLTKTEGEYPVVVLTALASPVLKGQVRLEMKQAVKIAPTVVITEENQGLYHHLRALRSDIAREVSLPSYMIFSDKSLQDMTHK